MDRLNVRIEAARLAVESGAKKDDFVETAKVMEDYILGDTCLLEYDNPQATLKESMNVFKLMGNGYEKEATGLEEEAED